MLMRISWDERNVVKRWKGGVVVELKYYTAFATGASISTIKEPEGFALSDKVEIDSGKVLKMQNLFSGVNGGISLG